MSERQYRADMIQTLNIPDDVREFVGLWRCPDCGLIPIAHEKHERCGSRLKPTALEIIATARARARADQHRKRGRG